MPPSSADMVELSRLRESAELIHDARAVGLALDRMAAGIGERLRGKNPVILAVMTGGIIPAVWLQARFDFLHQLDYVHASRYVGATEGGSISWLAGPRLALKDRHVLVVDDILDEGPTLVAIADRCRAEGAREVLSAVLTRKIHDRCVRGLSADFVGLEVPDRYVFGCGMDYMEHFRHLNAIYALPVKEEGRLR